MSNDDLAVLKIRETALVMALKAANDAIRSAHENRNRLNHDLNEVRATIMHQGLPSLVWKGRHPAWADGLRILGALEVRADGSIRTLALVYGPKTPGILKPGILSLDLESLRVSWPFGGAHAPCLDASGLDVEATLAAWNRFYGSTSASVLPVSLDWIDTP